MTRPAPPPLTPEQEALVRSSTVVRRLAGRMVRRTRLFTLDDLISIGNESLTRAARHFDPTVCSEFDGYAYRFVHLDMLRAIEDESKHQKRERASSFDAAYHLLEGAKDAGDIFADSAADARWQASDLAAGIFATIAARFLGDASRGSSEEPEARLDRERRLALLRREVDALAENGRVLVLRHFDGCDWEAIAESLEVSVATARRMHDASMRVLAARMLSRGRG